MQRADGVGAAVADHHLLAEVGRQAGRGAAPSAEATRPAASGNGLATSGDDAGDLERPARSQVEKVHQVGASRRSARHRRAPARSGPRCRRPATKPDVPSPASFTRPGRQPALAQRGEMPAQPPRVRVAVQVVVEAERGGGPAGEHGSPGRRRERDGGERGCGYAGTGRQRTVRAAEVTCASNAAFPSTACRSSRSPKNANAPAASATGARRRHGATEDAGSGLSWDCGPITPGRPVSLRGECEDRGDLSGSGVDPAHGRDACRSARRRSPRPASCRAVVAPGAGRGAASTAPSADSSRSSARSRMKSCCALTTARVRRGRRGCAGEDDGQRARAAAWLHRCRGRATSRCCTPRAPCRPRPAGTARADAGRTPRTLASCCAARCAPSAARIAGMSGDLTRSASALQERVLLRVGDMRSAAARRPTTCRRRRLPRRSPACAPSRWCPGRR